jgi:hypothetical protein
MGSLPRSADAGKQATMRTTSRATVARREGVSMAPHQQTAVVEEISSLLDRAGLTFGVDDDLDIHVTGGLDFPVWISVSPTRPFIRIFACAPLKAGEDVDITEALVLANEMTRQYMPNGCFYQDGAIWGQCFILFNNGLRADDFLTTLARSAAGFATALEECDAGGLVA